MPLQPRGAARPRPPPQGRASRLRDDAARTDRRYPQAERPRRYRRASRRIMWRDIQPDFRTSHYLDGFAHADKKFHFKADWAHPPFGMPGMGPWAEMPSLPDHWRVIEEADEAHPFRLATSPSRSFLNTSFNETPSSIAREGNPSVMIHPDGCRCSRDRRWRGRDARQHARRNHADRQSCSTACAAAC